MAIRRIGDHENIVLDPQTTQAQPVPSTLRKIGPNEQITLDADRSQLTARATAPVYFPQQQADTSILGHARAGVADSTRAMYALSGNVMDKLADASDRVQYSAQKIYYDAFGYPTVDPNAATDQISAPDGNFLSRGLRNAAEEDFRNERVLAGRLNAMNVQDSVTWDQVKEDPLSLKTGRFILEQGARSAPEMAVAFVPVVGAPLVAGSTTQRIIENRLQNQGLESTDRPSNNDLAMAAVTGVASAGLERLGVLGDVAKPLGGIASSVNRLSQIPGAMLRSGAGEAATEFGQEGGEYLGGTFGTDKDVTLAEFIDSGLQGAVIGGPMGAAVRGATETPGLVADAVDMSGTSYTPFDLSGIDNAAPGKQTASNIIDAGQSEQSIGGTESETFPIEVMTEAEAQQEIGQSNTPSDEHPTAPHIDADGSLHVVVPVGRNELADAINNGTELPESKVVDFRPEDIPPELQAQGFKVGSIAEQTDPQTGEVFSGTIAAGAIVDGEVEVTILDESGNLRTLFSSNGPILPQAQIVQPVAVPTAPVEPVVPMVSQPPPSNQPVSEQDILAAMPLDELKNQLEFINNQGKRNGWTGRITKRRDLLVEQLNARYPEWDVPTNVEISSAAEDVNPEPQIEPESAVSRETVDVPPAPPAPSAQELTSHDNERLAETFKMLDEAIERKNAETLRTIIGNLDNKRSRARFEEKTGQKLPKTKAGTLSFIDEFSGVSANDRAGIEAKKEGDRKEETRKRDVEHYGRIISSINIKNDDGSTTPVKQWVDDRIADGYNIVKKRGNVFVLAKSDGTAYPLSRFTGYTVEVRKYAEAVTSGPQQEPVKKSQTSENTQAEPESIDYNGTKISKVLVRGKGDGDAPRSMWSVQTLENKKRALDGKKESVLGDTLHETLEEAKKQADFDIRSASEKSEREARQEAKAKEEQEAKQAIDNDTYDGFLTGMEPNRKALVRKALSKQYNFTDGGGVMTVRERVDGFFKDGTLRTETIQEPKIKPMSRSQFNRADQKAQDAHDKRMREAGYKTTYLVNGSDVGKTGYDYANHLLSLKGSQEKKSTKETDPKIDDFGEKLDGAKKDLWKDYRSAMDDALPTEAEKITLSKHFPEPDFEKLIASGADIKDLAAIKAMRDEIPAKPKKAWRLKDWARKVEALRGFSNEILNGTYDVESLTKKMRETSSGLSMFADRIDMYNQLGYPAFTKAKDWSIGYSSYSMYNGERFSPAKKMWSVSKGHSIDVAYETQAEAIDSLRSRLMAEIDAGPQARKTNLDLFMDRKNKKYFIGKKVAAGKVIRIKEGFESAGEARSYMKENEESLLKSLEKKKQQPSERRDFNEDRVGKDYRGDENATPEKFAGEFGFRGVQFGNYVEQGRRSKDLNDAYDALLDMSSIIGVPPRAISLDGTLGLAFGARGSGGKGAAKAHYEPDSIVINLTKSSGAGSLGHEWFHALDNNFGKRDGNLYITENYRYTPTIRTEITDSFKGVMDAIRKTDMRERSKKIDSTRSKDYWSTPREMGARAFEAYLIHKADEKGEANDYLANIIGEETWSIIYKDTDHDNAYPYPTKKEMKEHIAPAFDKLFQTIKTSETESGIAMFSLGNRSARSLQSTLIKAANGLKQEKGTGDQILAMLRKTSGVKEEEIAWTGLDDFLTGRKGVSKQEVVDYLTKNQVVIDEVTLGSELDPPHVAAIRNRFQELSDKSEDAELSAAEEAEMASLTDELMQYPNPYLTSTNDTKFEKYTLPGGENYREVLLTLSGTDLYDPKKVELKRYKEGNYSYVDIIYDGEKQGSWDDQGQGDGYFESIMERRFNGSQLMGIKPRHEGFVSSHFTQPNILAHVRLNDRTGPNGERILFIEEIQSDWHQAGRKKGYKGHPVDTTGWTAAKSSSGAWQVKDAKGNYVGFGFSVSGISNEQDAIAYARDNVVDQADNATRVPDAPFKKTWHEMAFRRVVQMAAQQGYDTVAWTPGDVQNDRYDLSKQVNSIGYQKRGDLYNVTVWDKDDKRVYNNQSASLESLEDVIGKDMVQKIADGAGRKDGNFTYLEDLDLKIGGEGMKGFYDKILKSYAQKFSGKYGSQVSVISIENRDAISGESIMRSLGRNPDDWYSIPQSERDQMMTEYRGKGINVWSVPINDNMRDAADSGLELFSMTGAILSTKESSRRSAYIENAIRDEAERLGLPQTSLRLFEDPRQHGFPSNAEGAYWRGLVYIAMNSDNPISALRHEAIHALKRAKAFTAAEWDLLSSKADQWRVKYDIDSTYKDQALSVDKLREEAIAHAIQDHQQKGQITRIRNRIVRFFQAISNVLKTKKWEFQFNTIDDVFDYVVSGKTARRSSVQDRLEEAESYGIKAELSDDININEVFPVYKLGKSRPQALKKARESLSNVRGLDRSLKKDLGRVASTVLHPQQIATLYKAFTPVYMAVVNRNKQRDVLIQQLSKPVNLYNKMKQKSQDRVNAVLELGRLQGESFKPDVSGKIVVKNQGQKDAIFSKDGETITLTTGESAAYLGVRKSMDLALDRYLDTILERYGLYEDGVRSIQDVENLRLKAMKAGHLDEVRRFKNILSELNDVMDSKKRGYIPFKRWGEIGVSVKNADGDVVHFERLEIPSISQRLLNALKTKDIKAIRKSHMIGDNKDVQDALDRLSEKYADEDFDINFFEMSKFDEVSAYLDLKNLDILVASSEMSNADYQRLRDILQEEMQKKGVRSHFFRSKDVPGYSSDFERAINDYIVSMSSYVARTMNESKIESAVSSVSETGRSDLYEYAREYQQYVNDPAEEFAVIRSLGFFMYLAGNVSSGMLNTTQPILVTAPWFSSMFSHGRIGAEMTRAYKDTLKIFDAKDIMGDVFDFNKAPSDIREALIKAQNEGDFLSMATQDAMAISNSSRQSLRGLDKARRNVAEGIALTFSVPEKINRIVTFISAYRMAMDPKNKGKIQEFARRNNLARSMLEGKTSQEDFAFAFAELAVVSTQYRMGKLNRPKMARGIGSMPLQFYSFLLQTFELMYNLGSKNVHGDAKSKAALAVMILSIVALAGLKGLPFEDDMQELIEALFKFSTGKDLDIDTKARELIIKYTGSKIVAETIIKGVPASLLNVDLSGRLGFGSVTPDNSSDFLGVWWDMLYERPKRASGYINEGQVLRAIAEVAPAFARNPLQSYIWADDGIRTQKGVKVIDAEDLSGADIALKFFGFTSSDVSRERDRIYATDRASEAVTKLRSKYYGRLAKALAERKRLLLDNDKEGADEMTLQIQSIRDEIAEHNKTSAVHERINLNEYTIKQKMLQELSGAESKKIRKQARPRAEELKEIYGH